MNRSIQTFVAFGLLLVLTISAWAERGAGAEFIEDSPASPKSHYNTCWPSEKMVEALLRRWAAVAGEVYDLSSDQHRELAARMLERWPKFLEENRAELEPLLNEYLQARISGQPPSAESARAWAGRALPQLDQLRECLEAGNEEIAALLSDRQRAKFEADRSRLTTELEALKARFKSWSRGEYRQQHGARPSRHERVEGRAIDDTRAAKPDPGDEFEMEIDAWDQFVRAFIARYNLDDGQQATAESILVEMKSRARDHYQRNRLRIAAMEELIGHPRLETGKAEIEAELNLLYGPIDAMFRELEGRLMRIPTRAQKHRAEQPPKGS